MFEKIFSFPKRYWIMAHCIELVLGFLVLSGMNMYTSTVPLSLWETIMMYLSSFVFFTSIGVAVFPISIFMIHMFSEILEWTSEYTLIVAVVSLFVLYYSLWLIPDSRWSESQKPAVVRVRVIWFLIASVGACIAMFQSF